MLQNLKATLQSKLIIIAGFAAVAAASLSLVPATDASALGCRVFTPVQNIVGGGRVGTQLLTVPNGSTSSCRDINVRDISDPENPTNPHDTCATFVVAMYPVNGSATIYTKPKFACSKGPNGPVVPIATNVINGTKYRVFYNWEYIGQTHKFKIAD